ncbi:hypothetical protein J1N35_021440 [Gossypium stocksii]|uniref:Uncharacterized protein n=1 Tax=Gossypium stocksii TaxID=47602 RepID=A0A9D3VGQ9_9ROSI|nr:hypothetical protein J1N35_021440 [Gossypium stocksii]
MIPGAAQPVEEHSPLQVSFLHYNSVNRAMGEKQIQRHWWVVLVNAEELDEFSNNCGHLLQVIGTAVAVPEYP